MTIPCVLVTGAGGVIGHRLGQYLSSKGVYTIGIDRNRPKASANWNRYIISSLEKVDLVDNLQDLVPSHVIHLAGSSSVIRSVNDPYSDFVSLVPGTVRLLDWIRQGKHRPIFIFASSAAVYGNPRILPIPESAALHPLSPYGLHKEVAEKIITGYSRLYDIEFSILRLFSVYGPTMTKQVVWDIYTKLHQAIGTDKPVQLFGSGNETRDFIFIDDVCEIIVSMINSTNKLPSVLNIASGLEVKIKDLAACIGLLIGVDVPCCFALPHRVGYPDNWQADVNRLKSYGYLPNPTSLSQGLMLFNQWFHSTSF